MTTTPLVDLGNASIIPRSDYTGVIEEILKEGNCPFCRDHFLRHHPNPIIRESDEWVVTTNGWPYPGTTHHFLLIARKHVERIEDLSSLAVLAFFDEYQFLVQSHKLIGATILWRSGDTRMTGASVGHLHAHIIVGSQRTDTHVPITGLVGFRAQE